MYSAMTFRYPTSVAFEADNIVLSVEGIPDATDEVSYEVDTNVPALRKALLSCHRKGKFRTRSVFGKLRPTH